MISLGAFTAFRTNKNCLNFDADLPCDKQQHLYLLIDATASTSDTSFCQIITVVQMLVATFNPSNSWRSIMISGLTFPDDDIGPDLIFNSSADCNQVVDMQLVSLLSEFVNCKLGQQPRMFPSLCGSRTLIIPGLRKIHELATANNRTNSEGAVIIITDDYLRDSSYRDRLYLLEALRSMGINTIIGAAIYRADYEINLKQRNLMHYVSSQEDAIVRGNPIDLGIAIVQRMSANEKLCSQHGNFKLRLMVYVRDIFSLDMFTWMYRMMQLITH